MITIAEIENIINNTNNLQWKAATGFLDIDKAMNILNTKFENIIEIGTNNGFSAAILTNWTKGHVFTFDISHRNCDYIWDLLNVRNKISCFIGSREELEWEINYMLTNWKDAQLNIVFDLAFVDGNHEYEWVKRDFELVKFTGKVLFHDCDIIPDVRDFCNEIETIDICENITMWEQK